jgi:hypothetical protein
MRPKYEAWNVKLNLNRRSGVSYVIPKYSDILLAWAVKLFWHWPTDKTPPLITRTSHPVTKFQARCRRELGLTNLQTEAAACQLVRGAYSHHLWWRNFLVQGYDWWPWDKATILPMEKSKLSEIEKGETGEGQSQEHAHHFLWHHKDFVLEDQTVNSAYYLDVLRRLLENVRRLLPEIWWQTNWLLHHDREFFLQKTAWLSPPPTPLACLAPPHTTFLYVPEWR